MEEEHRRDKHKRKHHHVEEHGDDELKKHKRKHKDKESKQERKERKARKEKRSESRSGGGGVHVVDDDIEMGMDDDDSMWVERAVDVVSDIPTSASLALTSTAPVEDKTADLPQSISTETKIQRDEWMLLDPSNPTVPKDEDKTDWFSSMGIEKKRKEPPPKVDTEKDLIIHHRELNTQLLQGKSLDEYETPTKKPKVVPGGAGSQWRMMKLKRVYQTAEEEGRSVEDVALERYGNLEDWEEALEERRVLDQRGSSSKGSSRASSSKGGGGGETRYSYESNQPGRNNSFRRPGEATPTTPVPKPNAPVNRRLDSLRLTSNASGATPSSPSPARSPQAITPIPSVLTPSLSSSSIPTAAQQVDLNKLQAKVLKAKLMNAPNAAQLEKEFEEAKNRAQGLVKEGDEEEGNVVLKKVQVLPTVDVNGQLYDVGGGPGSRKGDEDPRMRPGNRKRKEKVVETRDPKTGDVIRVNADDDEITLGEMLRQEKFGAGMRDQKEMDAQMAKAIMGDGKFENDLDYMDDNAEKFGRKKMRTDAMKRQFALNDYAKTQKILSSCNYCFGEKPDGSETPPRAGVISMGTKVYLAVTPQEELTQGHCLIVPIQHYLCMLEADDEVWDEVRNFMKCLIRMYNEEGKGVVFYETVINFKWQQHTVIECIPLSYDLWEDLPGYFKESILTSESEWSTNKKLIDFSTRPGGFRRSMVKNLPYFMVQFDYKGEKGFGHVIEGPVTKSQDGDEYGLDEGEKGGGEFPKWFAAEIIGNLIDAEPRRWRKPRWVDRGMNEQRVKTFRKKYSKWDWTGMLKE